MTNKNDEIILAVSRKKLFENEQFSFQGFENDETVVDRVVENLAANFVSMRRGDAEENQEFKQPIPYALIRRGNEVFCYERLNGGGESRLHSKLSLGVGGHMNPIEDLEDFSAVLEENLMREINEELYVDKGQFDLNIVGLINDDSDEVGKVHISLLAIIDISNEQDVVVRELDQLAGAFVSIDKLRSKEYFDRLENWSKIALEEL